MMEMTKKLESIVKEIELSNGCAPDEYTQDLCRKVAAGEVTPEDAHEALMKHVQN